MTRLHHRQVYSYIWKRLVFKPFYNLLSHPTPLSICTISAMDHLITHFPPMAYQFRYVVIAVIKLSALHKLHIRVLTICSATFCIDARQKKNACCPKLFALLPSRRKEVRNCFRTSFLPQKMILSAVTAFFSCFGQAR